MHATSGSYSWKASIRRLKDILDAGDVSYEEKDSLPSRERLTFTNGFYANCTCIAIDIRNSSQLPSLYKRPKLARLYRSYLSEAVAVINSHSKCREVNVVGDGVWGVINTPSTDDIDECLDTAARLSSMIDILNCLLPLRGFEPIRVGIGLAWGRALMIQAGYEGSGINDVVYMGDVVNEANKLASWGSASRGDSRVMMSEDFHYNVQDEYQGWFSRHPHHRCFHGDISMTAMSEWVEDNCT